MYIVTTTKTEATMLHHHKNGQKMKLGNVNKCDILIQTERNNGFDKMLIILLCDKALN